MTAELEDSGPWTGERKLPRWTCWIERAPAKSLVLGLAVSWHAGLCLGVSVLRRRVYVLRRPCPRVLRVKEET